MTHDGYIEIGKYCIYVFTNPTSEGRWNAWTLFERKSDVAAGLDRIPGIRLQVPMTFKSQSEAVESAYEYADTMEAGGVVGL